MVILNVFAALVISSYSFITSKNGKYENIQVFNLPVQNKNGKESSTAFERWRVKINQHYSRTLVRDELPPFNEQELEELEKRICKVEEELSVRIGANAPARAGLSTKELWQRKLLGGKEPSLRSMLTMKSQRILSIPDVLVEKDQQKEN